MKLATRICAPALMLGAATLVVPAMAQNDTSAPVNSTAAAAAPALTAMNSQASSNNSANASSSSAGNSQMAMNTTGNAGDLASIPDNQHKYSRAKKAADDRSEDQTTKQLNQQESSLNGASRGKAQ